MKTWIVVVFAILFSPYAADAITLKPEDFGAVVDDGKSDAAAFQAMFNAIPPLERNVYVVLTSGEYLFDKTVFYPKYNRRRMLIEGNMASIKAVGNAFDLLTPAGIEGEPVSKALESIDQFIIRNCTFEGGDTQLRIAATLNSEISNCEFVGGMCGTDLVFCLMARVINSQFTVFRREGLLVRSGQGDSVTNDGKYFSNATGSNSQSNVVTIDGCRFFSANHAHACVRNYASNSMSILNTVFEGLPSKFCVDYQDRNSTTCTYMYMHNIHIEYATDTVFTQALIRAEQNGGIVHLDGIYSQTGRVVQVEAGKSVVKISNWAYFPGASKFKANGGGEWIFEENRGLAGIDLGDPAIWVGKPPYYIGSRFATTLESYSGWSPTLKNGDDYLSLTQGRLLQTYDSFFDQKNEPFKTPLNLDKYEIADLKTFIMTDPATGKPVSYYLPILKQK
jgi:hypothetical protein